MAEEEKKDDEKNFSDRQTKLVALTALLLAICATFSSLKAGGLTNAAILAQSQASDQWAYYQAKSLKENTYKVQIDQIKLHEGQFESEQAEKTIAKYQEKKQIMFWYASIVVGVIGVYYFFSTRMLL